MEETIFLEGEDENLNSSNPFYKEPKSYSEEEVEAIKKEIMRNSEKWVQKLLREIKLLKEASQKTESRVIEIEKQKFQDKLKMTPEEIDTFEEVFQTLQTTKDFDLEDLDKIFEKAYYISNIDYLPSWNLKLDETIWKLMTVSGGKGSSRMSKQDRESKIWAEVKEFLVKNKLI